MEEGINPLEVCSGDAFREAFGEVFGGAGGADAADSFCAGGWRVRRDCEDHHDHEHHRESDTAVGSGIIDVHFDDGDGDADHCERSRGKFGAVYGDGDGKLEYGCQLEREWNRGRVGGSGHDFVERELHGAGFAAESERVDDHRDERG